jgi:CheY-like chemotaxis protein
VESQRVNERVRQQPERRSIFTCLCMAHSEFDGTRGPRGHSACSEFGKMSATSPNEPGKPSAAALSKSTSELNNLLQIISDTGGLMRKAAGVGPEGQKYLEMLRTSIDRAEKVAADLAEQAGGAREKVALHASVASVPTAKANTSSAPKQSILLVDDEQMALTLLKRTLSEAGYEVTTAQSGFECLDIFRLRPHRFDLVLLDLTMPFMDGEETYQRLHDIRNDIPVVLCTGFILQERLTQMMASGLSGFLRKPLAPNEIVQVVRSTLESVRYNRDSLKADSTSAAS